MQDIRPEQPTTTFFSQFTSWDSMWEAGRTALDSVSASIQAIFQQTEPEATPTPPEMADWVVVELPTLPEDREQPLPSTDSGQDRDIENPPEPDIRTGEYVPGDADVEQATFAPLQDIQESLQNLADIEDQQINDFVDHLHGTVSQGATHEQLREAVLGFLNRGNEGQAMNEMRNGLEEDQIEDFIRDIEEDLRSTGTIDENASARLKDKLKLMRNRARTLILHHANPSHHSGVCGISHKAIGYVMWGLHTILIAGWEAKSILGANSEAADQEDHIEGTDSSHSEGSSHGNPIEEKMKLALMGAWAVETSILALYCLCAAKNRASRQ